MSILICRWIPPAPFFLFWDSSSPSYYLLFLPQSLFRSSLVLISQSWQVPTKIWSSNLLQNFRTGTLILLSNGFGEKFRAIFRATWNFWQRSIFLVFLRYFVLLSVFLCLEGLLDNRAWLRVKNTSTFFLQRNVPNFQSRFIAMYRSSLLYLVMDR